MKINRDQVRAAISEQVQNSNHKMDKCRSLEVEQIILYDAEVEQKVHVMQLSETVPMEKKEDSIIPKEAEMDDLMTNEVESDNTLPTPPLSLVNTSTFDPPSHKMEIITFHADMPSEVEKIPLTDLEQGEGHLSIHHDEAGEVVSEEVTGCISAPSVPEVVERKIDFQAEQSVPSATKESVTNTIESSSVCCPPAPPSPVKSSFTVENVCETKFQNAATTSTVSKNPRITAPNQMETASGMTFSASALNEFDDLPSVFFFPARSKYESDDTSPSFAPSFATNRCFEVWCSASVSSLYSHFLDCNLFQIKER